MSNWLDEAERRSRMRDTQGQSERLQVRIDRIKENYVANKTVYDEFVSHLKGLISRANNLPHEFRIPFGKLSMRHKQTRLNNHLHILSSSQRLRKRKTKDFWTWVFPVHIKHIRVVFVSVSKHAEMADLEIKESFLEKKRFRMDSKPAQGPGNKKHTDLVIHIPMNTLNKDLSQKILDFLAFKCELKDIPIDLTQATFY